MNLVMYGCKYKKGTLTSKLLQTKTMTLMHLTLHTFSFLRAKPGY
uniref:Uncharacterized protein n=1 Tax=Amphimedon queenslandica TaxID=400682 RepID=A0A1X7TGD3_AMPQE